MKYWIFWVGFSLGLLEPILRQFWVPWYFKYGIPLIRYNKTGAVRQLDKEKLNDGLSTKAIEVKSLPHAAWMIRRSGYGGVPRIFYRAFASMNVEEETVCVTLYVDYCPLLVGAFLCTVFIGESYLSVVLGLVATWIFHRIFLDRKWADEISELVIAQTISH